MNEIPFPVLRVWFRAFNLVLAALVLGAASSLQAGLTLEMNVIRYSQYGYYFSPNLGTNGTAPGIPFGDYTISSLNAPTNGSTATYHFDTNGFYQTGGLSWEYGDFNSMAYQLTNGSWSLVYTNATATNAYHFKVTANLSSNDLPPVTISFPADGSVNVTNQPTFAWQGPANYQGLVVYYFNGSVVLPVTQTNYPCPRTLYQGLNTVTVHYDAYTGTAVVASVPVNNALQPITSNWVSTNHLQDYVSSSFTVGSVDASGTSHFLVAHYPWDGTNADGTVSGVDTSGNGYDLNFGGSQGALGGHNFTADAKAGPGAIQFHNGDGNSAGYVGWNPTPTNLLGALAGSFSVSCWIKTTQSGAGGWDQAPAYYGAGIVSADLGGLANDVIPLALTGGRIAFNTGGDVEDVTLNSLTPVNDGNFHHIVVTRNQGTGQKIIYIDGVLDSFSSGTTNLLSDPQLLTVGALADAGNPDAGSAYYYNGFDGEVDDLQIYSGVLSAGEVANLFAAPGSTAANGGGLTGGHQNVAHYTFDNSENLGQDSSGHANDLPGETWWGTQHQPDPDAAAGYGAIRFFGTDAITPFDQVRSNLNAVLAGSFTFSAWVNTTVTNGLDYNNAFFGGVIFWAYNDQGGTNDTIPLSITGSRAAFTTRDHLGNYTTLHSLSRVNDGQYHLLTVTRNQASGEMRMYVDGHFETSATGPTDPLNGNNYNLTLGGWAYVIDGTGTNYSSYNGLLDDVQIYRGVLSDTEVGSLYASPGSTVPDQAGSDFGAALNTTNAVWASGGDLPWFVESAVSLDGEAAQSGPVADNQTSYLQTTAPASGRVVFNWKVSSEDGSDFLTFYINGIQQAAISGEVDWNQEIYPVTAGDVLRWEYSKDGSVSVGQDAGWLDQVLFSPVDTSPVSAAITLDIYQEQDPTFGNIFFAFPSFNSVIPAGTGTTTNTIESPSGWFTGFADAGGNSSGSPILGSLGQLVNECTNGLWSLRINKGTPGERQFQFSVTISGLTTNLLSAVKIITPTNGATAVPPNTPFRWTGPTNFPSLSVYKQNRDGTGYAGVTLPATATNWPSPPVLTIGTTNQFHVEYVSNHFAGVTFSIPVDTVDSQTVSNWVAQANLRTTADSIFVVSAAPLPPTLTNPRGSGTNFQFSFQSQSGFTHNILYRTNLNAGSWLTYTNITGDGTLKTIPVPFSLFSPSKQGFIRVTTQ